MLWKGTNLYQIYYNAADLRFSDHRPVCAKFICTINVIDEFLKAQLRQALYDERQHGMHDSVAKGIMQVNTLDREAIQPADIASVLPLASSDNSKWWLGDGMCIIPHSSIYHAPIISWFPFVMYLKPSPHPPTPTPLSLLPSPLYVVSVIIDNWKVPLRSRP